MEKKNQNNNNNNNNKVKLMCSYGGKIQPRRNDHRLSYVGGDTKILSVDRHVRFSDFVAKLTSLLFNNSDSNSLFALKYQLPDEDLDALVSVMNDDDLRHMMTEYDRAQAITRRLRLFLFPLSRTGPVQEDNNIPGSESAPFNPDFLFGFDKEYEYPVQTEPVQEENIHKEVVREQKVPEAREKHVTNGGYAVGPVGPQPVYLLPVTAGGVGQYVRLVYSEQPVYSYVTAAVVEETANGGHVAKAAT